MNIERHHESQASWEKTQMTALPSCYAAPESVDHWRHRRMYELVGPLLTMGSRWLTIGDGRYGSDAYVLTGMAREKGGDISVTASSITTATLDVAHERGWIREYAELNAEDMNVESGSFDYVFCKETYHHLPRPQVGLYEMIRVARQAVVVIEPTDPGSRPLDWLKRQFKLRVRGDLTSDFEAAGNFIYRVNATEFTKVATAIGLPAIAYRTFNDAFVRRFAGSSARGSIGAAATRVLIGVQGMLSRLRLLSPGLIAYIIFIEHPSPEVREGLRRLGYHFASIPRNPFADRDSEIDARNGY